MWHILRRPGYKMQRLKTILYYIHTCEFQDNIINEISSTHNLLPTLSLRSPLRSGVFFICKGSLFRKGWRFSGHSKKQETFIRFVYRRLYFRKMLSFTNLNWMKFYKSCKKQYLLQGFENRKHFTCRYERPRKNNATLL